MLISVEFVVEMIMLVWRSIGIHILNYKLLMFGNTFSSSLVKVLSPFFSLEMKEKRKLYANVNLVWNLDTDR